MGFTNGTGPLDGGGSSAGEGQVPEEDEKNQLCVLSNLDLIPISKNSSPLADLNIYKQKSIKYQCHALPDRV